MRSPETREPRRITGMSFSWLGLELGVLGASVAAFAGMARLFTNLQPMATILVAVLLTQGVCVSCRWAKLPAIFAAIISGLAVGLSAVSAAFPKTFHHLIIPTHSTYDDLVRAGYESWNQFITVKAPTQPFIGFTLAAVAGAWITVVVSDTIAFRLGFLVEALVPPGVVMVLVAALAPSRYRLEAILAFSVSVALVVTSARVRELSREAWLGRRPRRAGTIGAVVLICTSLGVTGFVATHPPRWATSGLIDLQGNTKNRGVADRSKSDPLVSTRARLVEQSTVEMFQVNWPGNTSYWRQTTLDIYNPDESWAPNRSPGVEQPTAVIGAPGESATIAIQSLRSNWLPVPDNAALVLTTGGTPSPDVQRDATAEGFLVSGMRREVNYIVRTTAQPAEGVADRSRQLNIDGVAPDIIELARSITNSGRTDEEKARLLERWFLSNFVYDLNVALTAKLGLHDFLFSDRRGYCEQFASSFAVMARALGIPSRVAVGFVRGDYSASSMTYQVRGKDAHAWPEVFVDNHWKRFEPTPGRGDATTPEVAPSTTTTTAPPTTVFATPTTVSSTTPVAPKIVVPAKPLNLTPLWVLLGLIATLCVPTLVRRLRGRRGIAPDAADFPVEVTRSMVGLEDDLAWIGCPRPPGRPLNMFLDDLSEQRLDPDDLHWLGGVEIAVQRVETLRYSGESSAPAAALQLIADARTAVQKSTPVAWKVRRFLSFRPRPRATSAATS
jgi:transglutaminase-like putative cysteine protease